MTEYMTGGINGDIVVVAPVPCSPKPLPGVLLTRVVRTVEGIVVHLIDLRDQDEVAWDAGKNPMRVRDGITLEVSFVAPGAEVLIATVDQPDLEPLVA